MAPRSQTSSPREKPYDQGSDSSSEEDFVNAGVPRSSSRASAASGASRSSRKPEVVSESSTDSEEERELESELQDAAGTETGVVRGVPVESTKEKVMRSIGKSGSSRQAQRYASLGTADLEAGRRSSRQSGSSRSGSTRKSHRSRSGASTTVQNILSDYSKKQHGHTEPKKNATVIPVDKPKTKRVWLWVLGGILGLAVLAAIIAAVVIMVKRNSASADGESDIPSNSTSLADHKNATMSSNSTVASHGSMNATGTSPFANGSHSQNASPINTASFDDGKYHPATPASSALNTAGTQLDLGSAQGNSQASQVPVSGHSDDHSALAKTTPAQVYGVPAATPGAESGSDLAATGTVGGIPKMSQTPQDPAKEHPEASASNAGPWNPLSQSDANAAQSEGPGANQQPASSNVPQFGLGQGAGSTTGVSQAEATPASQAGDAHATAAGDWNAPGANGEQAQPASPVDSNASGPYTAATFKQATHPEPFQTYLNAPATFFESSGHYGACGIAANNTDYVVAINNAIWLNSTKGSETDRSPLCGAEVLLTSMADGATVNAWVTDRCAYCSTEGAGSIDLSKAAFSALAGGSTDIGSLTLVWGLTGNSSLAPAAPVLGKSAAPDSHSTMTGSANATATTEEGGRIWRRQTAN